MLLAGPISHTSTQYIDFVDFLHFNGSVYQLFCSFWWVLSFACSCHYPRMLCQVFWSQVEYKIVCFISLICSRICSLNWESARSFGSNLSLSLPVMCLDYIYIKIVQNSRYFNFIVNDVTAFI